MEFSKEFNFRSNHKMYEIIGQHKPYKYHNVNPFITPPPSQDSPNHILNALSDTLIQRVLGYLIWDIRDFLSAAETCKKFQENAEKCFPPIYEHFIIEFFEDHYGEMGDYLIQLPLHRVKDFLSIFGHLIRSLNWDKHDNVKYDCEIFGAIKKFCGKNLLGLRIMRHNVDFNMGSQFLNLEELLVIQSIVINFEPPTSLKKLCLGCRTTTNNLAWMSKTYPNLNEISFHQLEELNDEAIVEFQAFNPQLTFFDIMYCRNVTSSVFNGIAMRLPNLARLLYNFSFKGDSDVTLQRKLEVDVLHLGGLRQLKSLFACPNILNCSIFDSLAALNAPIEELKIVSGFNPRMAESLCKLTNMRKLYLDNFGGSMVVDIAKNLPNLERLEIRYAHMSLNEVIQILEHGRNLKYVFIQDDQIKVDSDILLDGLLNLARGRTRVVLSVSYSNISVSLQRFFNADISKWFVIKSSNVPPLRYRPTNLDTSYAAQVSYFSELD